MVKPLKQNKKKTPQAPITKKFQIKITILTFLLKNIITT
jgi:hypothetical protein